MNPLALSALWFAIKRQSDSPEPFTRCEVDRPLAFFNEIARASQDALSRQLTADVGKAQETKSLLTPTQTSKKSGTETFSASPTGAI